MGEKTSFGGPKYPPVHLAPHEANFDGTSITSRLFPKSRYYGSMRDTCIEERLTKAPKKNSLNKSADHLHERLTETSNRHSRENMQI